MTRPNGWRILQLALLALVGFGLYRVVSSAIADAGAADLLRWTPSPIPLMAASMLLLAVYVSHALLWRKIMSDLDIARPSVRATLRIYFLASLGRYIPGRIWQLAGLAALSQQAGMPAVGAAGAAVIGQICFLSTGLILLALVLPGWAETRAAVIGAMVLAALATGVWGLLASRRAGRVRARIRTIVERRIGEGAGNRIGAAFGQAERVRGARAARWLAAYALTWIALGVAFTVFVVSFVPEASIAGRQLAGIVAASYLAGYLAVFAPAGLGVRELAMTAMLAELIPGPAALVVALASRLWFTAAELAPLAIVPLMPRGRSTAQAG